MLDQLDHMQVSTSVPNLPACSSLCSCAIGPIDPAQIITLQAHLSTGQDIALLTPAHLPSSVLSHPEFKEGYEWGYLSDIVTDRWSIPQIVNDVYANLKGVFVDEDDPDAYPWTMGELLGGLSRIAQTDQTLALVGMGYLCFLLPLFSQGRPADWPRRDPYHAAVLHDRAVKAYRVRMRSYRQQGQSFEQAQRSALLPCSFAFGTLPDARPPQPADSLSALLAHPEFQQGLAAAQAAFLHEYEPAPLTEEEMIDEVEAWISRDGFELDKTCRQGSGSQPHIYLYNLGLTVGTIGQGLRYAH